MLGVSGINAITYTDATPTVPELWPKLVDAVRQVAANRFTRATHPKTDVPASALARGFVLAGLAEAEEPDTVQALLQRVESDLAKLRRVVGTE
jgi:hypothetical protein